MGIIILFNNCLILSVTSFFSSFFKPIVYVKKAIEREEHRVVVTKRRKSGSNELMISIGNISDKIKTIIFPILIINSLDPDLMN